MVSPKVVPKVLKPKTEEQNAEMEVKKRGRKKMNTTNEAYCA